MAASIWTFFLAVGCGLLLTPAEVSGCTHYATLGQRYELPLNAVLKPGDRVVWKTDDKTVYDSKRASRYTYKTTEKGYLILPTVTNKDRKKFIWEIITEGTREGTGSVFLCPQEAVSKPTVTFTCDEKQNRVQFNCSVPQQNEITYQWFEGGNRIVANEKDSILVRFLAQVGSNSFYCNVSNYVSSQSSDPVQQTCLKPSFPVSPISTISSISPISPIYTISPNSEEEDDITLFGLDFWLMVGILAGGGGLVLIIIVTCICCCCRNRGEQGI